MQNSLIYFVPASWFVFIPVVFLISCLSFFISLKIFMLENSSVC